LNADHVPARGRHPRPGLRAPPGSLFACARVSLLTSTDGYLTGYSPIWALHDGSDARATPPGEARAWERTDPAGQARVLTLEHSWGIPVGPTAQAAARTLGFPDLTAYLTDRYVTRRWPQRLIAAEIGLHPDWLRKVMQSRRIPRGHNLLPGTRHHGWVRVKLSGRLAELGFGDLDSYLLDRYRDKGWRVLDLQAELGCGRGLVRTAVLRLGIMRRHR